jgi:hypothetical protein
MSGSAECAETMSSRLRSIPMVCSPPRLPANSGAKRLVDRIQPTGAWQWVYFAAVAAAVITAPLLPTRFGLILDAAATFAASAWCLLNLWRCREAHCVVTGIGWAALFILEITELLIGRSVIHGDEGLVFVGVLVVGCAFECGWQARFGTNGLHRAPHAAQVQQNG